MFCRTTSVLCEPINNYLLTCYPVRTENIKPSVMSHGPHFFRSVLCDFGLRIFHCGTDNQLINRYCQILVRQAECRKGRAKISADTSARLFMVTCLKYTDIQQLNCKCQELNPTHFTVSLVPTLWVFTPPGEFYPQS